MLERVRYLVFTVYGVVVVVIVLVVCGDSRGGDAFSTEQLQHEVVIFGETLVRSTSHARYIWHENLEAGQRPLHPRPSTDDVTSHHVTHARTSTYMTSRSCRRHILHDDVISYPAVDSCWTWGAKFLSVTEKLGVRQTRRGSRINWSGARHKADVLGHYNAHCNNLQSGFLLNRRCKKLH